ncbi:MAG: bifunctional acetate--CoA ligase family protein/GNAT family N-acetyltransferase [Alphaproteobacteria bacterium]
MTVRNLDRLFRPRSVALIGASRRPRAVGQVVARNLLRGGFAGVVMPVNPREQAIEGVLAYPDIESLPVTPDLAVIATPPDTVPDLIDRLGRRGTRAAVVITAGFGEGAEAAQRADGAALRQRMLDAARPHLLRIVGPNCVGVMVPPLGLDASFGHVAAKPGPLAFVAQSGAVIVSVLDWAAARGIGFSHFVSLGDMADVDFGDMIDWLASDRDTQAILLYVEAITSPRKFMSAARIAARTKPVVVIKAGRHAAAARAAASHTGALAGSDAAFDAAVRRAGMLRVTTLEELFAAVETLAAFPHPQDGPRGDRLAILTNGGGIGVLATDALIDAGGRLAELAPETIARLDAALPATWSHGNPVDIIGDAPGERYAAALEALLDDPGADAVLVLNCPTAVAAPLEAAEAVADTLARRAAPRRPVLTAWLGGEAPVAARRLFGRQRVPTYEQPTQAVQGFMHLVRWNAARQAAAELPASTADDFAADVAAARDIVAHCLADGREWLDGAETATLLTAYGIATLPAVHAGDAAAAGRAAAAMAADAPGGFALKVQSRDIVHKSDIGGVVLDLPDAAAVARAATAMDARIAASRPEARREGFLVQAMAPRRGDAHELICGVVADRQFGPVVLFGQGGTTVELVGDTALALPPLNTALARELMGRTRVDRLLAGWRGRPAADREAVAAVLVRLSRLATELGELAEIEINPLLASPSGVLAVDARVRVAAMPEGANAADRLAILPYPRELEERVEAGGEAYLLRPIRPEDARAYPELAAHITAKAARLRFHMALSGLDDALVARLTQIDYDREMAFVLADPGRPAGEAALYAVARFASDPDGEMAEFAIIVRSDREGLGLGRLLLGRLLAFARRRGIATVWGSVLRENVRMIDMCRRLGFRIETHAEEREAVKAVLDL